MDTLQGFGFMGVSRLCRVWLHGGISIVFLPRLGPEPPKFSATLLLQEDWACRGSINPWLFCIVCLNYHVRLIISR